MTSADSDRYGLRPRLATLTAMRPPGFELVDALGEHVLEHREVLDVGGRDVALAQLRLVGLPGEVRRRGDHQRHRRRPHAVHRAGVAHVDLVDHPGGSTVSSVLRVGAGKRP